MRILSLDPGSSKSALVTWDTEPTNIESHYESNENTLSRIRGVLQEGRVFDCMTIESPRPRGQLASSYLFDTIYWAGIFAYAFEVWNEPIGLRPEIHRIARQDAAREITGNNATTARQLKQGIIEYFGGDEIAVGGVKCPRCKGKGWRGSGRPTCDACNGNMWEVEPGNLYEFSKQGNGDHPWDALAVAIAHYELEHKDA